MYRSCARRQDRQVSAVHSHRFPPSGPTLLYEDNKAAINMVNANRPTERSRHIDIQHFAIQEWGQRGDIKLTHIPGVTS
jgi:hypothetical protein